MAMSAESECGPQPRTLTSRHAPAVGGCWPWCTHGRPELGRKRSAPGDGWRDRVLKKVDAASARPRRRVPHVGPDSYGIAAQVVRLSQSHWVSKVAAAV